MNLYYKFTESKHRGKTIKTPLLASQEDKDFELADGSIIDNPSDEEILEAGYLKIELPEKPSEVISGKEWQLQINFTQDSYIAKYESIKIQQEKS